MTIKAAARRDDLQIALEKEAANRRRRSSISLARDMLLAILLLAGIGGVISLTSYGVELIAIR